MGSEQEPRRGLGETPHIRKALQQVWDSLGYISKKGTFGGAGGWAYATESDVKREFHRLLLRHGLIMTLSERTIALTPHLNKDKSAGGYLCVLTCDLTLCHVDSGETFSVVASGAGIDSGEKSVGKAYSYLVKTWWLNSNLIESGDDVEGKGRRPESARGEHDENDEKLDREMITDLLQKALDSLKAVEPRKGAAKERYQEILARHKATSGRPAEFPDQLKTREEGRQALALLRKAYTRWNGERFEKESLLEPDAPPPVK